MDARLNARSRRRTWKIVALAALVPLAMGLGAPASLAGPLDDDTDGGGPDGLPNVAEEVVCGRDIVRHHLNNTLGGEAGECNAHNNYTAPSSLLPNGLPNGDADSDGVKNGLDNCPAIANADQTNTDGDALGDACDLDDDNDGVPDATDNCRTTPNPGQANGYGTAAGDACEDTDGDAKLDAADNCPLVANANQTNTDGDALGDACDPDDDNDDVPDATDNCQLVANTNQTNTDKAAELQPGAPLGDGLGDACDPDDDNDDVLDGAEAAQGQRTDPLDWDTDNDLRGDSPNTDNCPANENADQANTDGEGRGDECDGDRDGDGIPDPLEWLLCLVQDDNHPEDGVCVTENGRQLADYGQDAGPPNQNIPSANWFGIPKEHREAIAQAVQTILGLNGIDPDTVRNDYQLP